MSGRARPSRALRLPPREKAEPRGQSHIVANVKFRPGQRGDDGTVLCTCGWEGRAADFGEHRRDAGAVDRRGDSVSPRPFSINPPHRGPKAGDE